MRWSCWLARLPAAAQNNLSVHWEELTGPDFIAAIHQAQGVCVLPFGIIEKHGPHLPLGTDLINVRFVTEKAAQQEYAVVFPAYYFGQIAEARQQPGTVSYSAHMQLDLLQETTDEMARNGCRKIVIVNGHGGNEHLLPFFAQAQMQTPHDYVVYVYRWPGTKARTARTSPGRRTTTPAKARRRIRMIAAPGLVHMDRAQSESGADLGAAASAGGRLHRHLVVRELSRITIRATARWRRRQLGEYDTKAEVGAIADVIRAVKADERVGEAAAAVL